MASKRVKAPDLLIIENPAPEDVVNLFMALKAVLSKPKKHPKKRAGGRRK